MAIAELEEQQASLNGLTEADAVGDEESRRTVAQHCQRGLELVGQETNRRSRGGVKRSERMQLQQRAASVQPAAGGYCPGRGRWSRRCV